MSALKKKRTDRGVTLIEVLVSGVLVSLSAIGILGVFSSGYMMINKARILHRATELAREKVEELNNQAIEDIYPTVGVGGGADDEFDGCGEVYTNNDDTKQVANCAAPSTHQHLTTQKVVGQFVPGSDYVIFCPVDGYANRGYVYTDWDDTGLGACNATGLFIDATDALDDNGPGGVPDGYIQRKVTLAPPCVYKIIPVRCQNRDVNGDGIETDPHPSPVLLPRISQAGFFSRTVKVKPKKAKCNKTVSDTNKEGCEDYQYDTASTQTMWQAAGYSIAPADLRRGVSRTVPVKVVDVIVKWRAHGEEQSYSVKTILSRLVPKYSY